MYQSVFGITAPPFQLTADPRFYFASGKRREALELLRNWSTLEHGVVVVTGAVGVGKTTLVRTLLEGLDRASFVVANVVSTHLDADDLLSAIGLAFGVDMAESDNAGDLQQSDAETLRRFLAGVAASHRRALLILDEAQNLPGGAFDRLLELATHGAPGDPCLQIWLVGQSEVETRLEAAASASLRALIRGTCHLVPFNADETAAYIEHRLGMVGWTGTPAFEDGAFAEIFRWTHGVPRRINQLCNRVLIARSLDAQLKIDAASVHRLASELGGEIGLERDVVEPPSPDSAAQGAARPAAIAPNRHRVTSIGGEDDAPYLCVAADYGDHVKAAALMRALVAKADSGAGAGPAAVLLRVHESDALAACGRLYKGLDIARRRVDLSVPEGPHDAIVLDLMTAFAGAVERLHPRAVVVFDGSPTAFACATVARAKRIPVVHVGAGVRIADRFVAAAATRRMTDHLSDLLFTTDSQASRTLGEEGLPPERVHCVGNLAVDSIRYVVARLRSPPRPYFRNHYGYALVVLSDPANMAGRDPLVQLTDMLGEVSRVIPIVWLLRSGLHGQLKKYHLVRSLPNDRVHRVPAQPYVEYVALLQGATCVLTDSWTVQEEATALRVPCLVIGVFPERPLAGGSTVSVGLSRTRAVSAVWEYVLSGMSTGRAPPLWDGRTGARIAGYLAAWTPTTTAPAATPSVY